MAAGKPARKPTAVPTRRARSGKRSVGSSRATQAGASHRPAKTRAVKAQTKPAKRAPATSASRTSARGGTGRVNAQHEVEQFLYRQAELLDGKRWQDYIDLFTDAGIYWMPARPEDTTWDGVPSIFAEDKDLMTVRMKRVLHPDAWSQRPLWGTNHVIGNVIVEKDGGNGDVVVRSRFHMLELRRDEVRHFAGSYVHRLRKTRDGYRIVLQRVDVTNAQAAYDYVLQVWV